MQIVALGPLAKWTWYLDSRIRGLHPFTESVDLRKVSFHHTPQNWLLQDFQHENENEDYRSLPEIGFKRKLEGGACLVILPMFSGRKSTPSS